MAYTIRNPQRIVIDGGPGIGKTTLLENLAARGFTIVPEAARSIIEEQQKKGTDLLPWLNNYEFQKLVLKRQLELENSYEGKLQACDRGFFGSKPFCECAGVPTPTFVDRVNPRRYSLIVIPEILPVFVNDTARKETPEQARKIHEAHIRHYTHGGYSPFIIPVLPRETRGNYLFKGLEDRRII
ncbi:ATP-binding protein [Candidatus Pacearchaeota archaeon]|nr:ATP-binding protein [Candidatus Pacearchaeota archaeon]